jgi:hypothetical protein
MDKYGNMAMRHIKGTNGTNANIKLTKSSTKNKQDNIKSEKQNE